MSGRVLDIFPTPRPLAAKIVSLLPIADCARILEPSAGTGSFVAPLRRLPLQQVWIEAVEIRPECRQPLVDDGADEVWIADFESGAVRGRGWNPTDPAGVGFPTRAMPAYDWVIGNPPYTLAEAHIRHAMSFLRHGAHLVFLLRLNFLGSQGRVALWEELAPRHIWAISERPGFKSGSGTDMTEYAAFWWTKGWAGATTLSMIPYWKPGSDSGRLIKVPFVGGDDFDRQMELESEDDRVVDQPGLPFVPGIPQVKSVTGIADPRERFEAFHRLNPQVYRGLRDVALELRRNDWTRCSMKMLFERLRWVYALRTQGDTFQLNNNYTSYYARLLMVSEPTLAEFFEVRKQRGTGKWEPTPES